MLLGLAVVPRPDRQNPVGVLYDRAVCQWSYNTRRPPNLPKHHALLLTQRHGANTVGSRCARTAAPC